MLFKKKKKSRACVIGLDGVPHSLLVELCRSDVMPALAGLLETGRLHKMKASLPEISSVSWSDFMTGANSGTHGIFGFTDLKPGTYQVHYPNFFNLRAKTFWDILSDRGKTSVIINQPSTFPAKKINGVLISGFTAFDLSRSVYPPSELAHLKNIGYEIDLDEMKIRDNPDSIWPELDRILDLREKALDRYWPTDWDFLEFVVTDTDRLHHFMWNRYEDRAHPDRRKFFEFYERIDSLIGKIADSFRDLTGGNDGLYLLSDHGFCQIQQEVYLNHWLKKEGYLRFSKEIPDGIGDISGDSTAFILEPNRLYLHRKDKYPRGNVLSSEVDKIKAEIKRKLEALEFDGRKIVRNVFDAEEIYSGPLVPQGPDMIVLSEYGYDLKGSIKKADLFGRTLFQGMHTWDDAFFWTSGKAGDDLKISDLSEIILGNFK